MEGNGIDFFLSGEGRSRLGLIDEFCPSVCLSRRERKEERERTPEKSVKGSGY